MQNRRIGTALARLEAALSRLEAREAEGGNASAAPSGRGEEITAIRGMIAEAISLIDSQKRGHDHNDHAHHDNGGRAQ